MFNKRKGEGCGEVTAFLVIVALLGVIIFIVTQTTPYRPDYWIYDEDNKIIKVVYNLGSCFQREDKIVCLDDNSTYYIPKGSTVREINTP